MDDLVRDTLPDDGLAGTLVGRAWLPAEAAGGVPGPSPVWLREDGVFELVGLPAPGRDGRTGVVQVAGASYVELGPQDGRPIEAEIVTVVAPTWSEDVLRTVAEAAAR